MRKIVLLFFTVCLSLPVHSRAADAIPPSNLVRGIAQHESRLNHLAVNVAEKS